MHAAGISPRHAAAHLQTNCRLFETLEGKREAFQIAEAYAKKGFILRDHLIRRSLIFCGPVGTGKTWLATGVFKDMLWRQKRVRGVWCTFGDLVADVQSSYSDSSRSAESVLQNYKRAGLLLVDDFGDMDSMKESDDKRNIIYQIVDHRNSNDLPTLITTNLELGEMRAKWGERAFERIMEMSKLVPVTGVNLRRNTTLFSRSIDLFKDISEGMKILANGNKLPTSSPEIFETDAELNE